MNALDETKPHDLDLPLLLRRAAGHLPSGPDRTALLRYADAFEPRPGPSRASNVALHDALAAPGVDSPFPGQGLDEPFHMTLPPYLRREAQRHPPGPNRDAVLRYADELEEKGDAELVSRTALRDALRAMGTEYDDTGAPMEPPAQEPAHIRLPPILRRDAERHPPGPNRDALLRYADELEEKGDDTLVERSISRDALKALGTEYDDEGNPIETPALEPLHITLPPRLRRKAQRHPPGPNREALLRYADELDEKRDDALVERSISRDALRAYATDCNDPPE